MGAGFGDDAEFVFAVGGLAQIGFIEMPEEDGVGIAVGGGEMGSNLMRNSTLENRNLDEVLLGRLNTLSNGSLNFACLTKTVTYDTIAITYYNDSGESKGAATLGNLSNTIDSNQTVLQLDIIGILYSNHICHLLEFETTFAGTFCQGLYAAVIEITIAIENNLSDAGSCTLLSDSLTNLLGNLSLGALGDTL